MQSQSSVLKRLYERAIRLTGKVKWKSRLSHYLLTIHYWIRYTRFRIPIAKSFLRRATVSIRIVSTNKHANTRSRSDLRWLYVCALIRVLEINPTPKGRVGPAGVFVQKIRTRRSKLVYSTHPTPLFSLPSSLSIPCAPPFASPSLPRSATGNSRSPRCGSRVFFFPHSKRPLLVVFSFLSMYIWFRNILAIVPTMLVRKAHSSCGNVTSPTCVFFFS